MHLIIGGMFRGAVKDELISVHRVESDDGYYFRLSFSYTPNDERMTVIYIEQSITDAQDYPKAAKLKGIKDRMAALTEIRDTKQKEVIKHRKALANAELVLEKTCQELASLSAELADIRKL